MTEKLRVLCVFWWSQVIRFQITEIEENKEMKITAYEGMSEMGSDTQ